MRNRQSTRIPKTLVLLAVGLVLAGVTAATRAPAKSNRATALVTKYLCAKAGTLALPAPAAAVDIWSFVQSNSLGDCATAVTLPGQELDVAQGDDVKVNIKIDASLSGRDVSFELPGLPVTSCTPDPGFDVCAEFIAARPGTFGYQSPGDAGRQEAMGLTGALIVNPATPGQAYDGTTTYDVQATLVLSAIDPEFNADPDNFDLHAYNATFWLINGKAYPNTDPIHAATGQKLLLRFVNAGFDNTTMTLVGMREHVVARDAFQLPNPFDANAETIPAGGTEDAIATVPAYLAGGALVNGFPLYNRQLHVTNGTNTSTNATYSAGYAPGGMLTFIKP